MSANSSWVVRFTSAILISVAVSAQQASPIPDGPLVFGQDGHFHRLDCQAITPARKLLTTKEAVAARLSPCPVCKPPEPDDKYKAAVLEQVRAQAAFDAAHAAPKPTAQEEARRAAVAQRREIMERDHLRGVIYFVTKTESVRESSDLSSKVLVTLKPYDSMLVIGAIGGWIRVFIPTSDIFERGWLPLAEENLDGNQLTIPTRELRIKELDPRNTWPLATRLAILRGRIQIGYTKEQADIALAMGLGKSRIISKTTEETAAGIVELWYFADGTCTFEKGRVTRVTRVQR